jgi:hypothetical protein
LAVVVRTMHGINSFKIIGIGVWKRVAAFMPSPPVRRCAGAVRVAVRLAFSQFSVATKIDSVACNIIQLKTGQCKL